MTGWHPLWLQTLPWLPPHLTFDVLAVVVGLGMVWRARSGTRSPLPVSVMALVGAVLGARLLGLLVDPTETWSLRLQPGGWMQQKTVLGGILGGWTGVELAKARLGIRHSTADRYVGPLLVSMAVGRLGCFFSGVTDRTHGIPTALPWGMDLGDGLPRHPLALYELGVLVSIAAVLRIPFLTAALRWRTFVLLYMGWRFASAPLAPPQPTVGPLTTLQVAALVGMVAAGVGLWRHRRSGP